MSGELLRKQTACRSYNKDEMCNFYLMYWTAGTDPLDQKYCFSPGPPLYRWQDEFSPLPEDASILSPSESPRTYHHHHHQHRY